MAASNDLNSNEKSPLGCPRDSRGRFIKGVSGNNSLWTTRRLNKPLAQRCRERAEAWIDVLDEIITGDKVDSGIRLGAIKLGFQYGFGTPLQGDEVSRYEINDYKGYINYLAREIHQKFDFSKIDILKCEQEIKDFITETVGHADYSDMLFDDVLKQVGSWAFQNYLKKLNESDIYYKCIE